MKIFESLLFVAVASFVAGGLFGYKVKAYFVKKAKDLAAKL